MARKNSKYAQIPSERVRHSTLKRRLENLFKKAHELTVLCDVDIAIIVHNPNDGHTMLWPSQEKAANDVDKFLSIPEQERLKKMLLQENLMMEKVQEMADRLSKLRKKNEETELGFIMNQLINGKTFDRMEVGQLNGLSHLVDEKLKKLQTRKDELDGPLQVQDIMSPGQDIGGCCHPFLQVSEEMRARQSQNSCAPAGTPLTTLLREIIGDDNDDRFCSENMFSMANNLNLWKETDTEPRLTKAASPFTEGNHQGELDDFSQLWPSIFSS